MLRDGIAFVVSAVMTLSETIQTSVIPGVVTLGGIGVMFLGIYLSRITMPIRPEGAPASAAG